MKHPFDLDNFESFLSEQADQHRMYASDRIWRNIQESLHGIDRWPALTFASILTVSIIAVILTITYPNRQLINTAADYSGIASQKSDLSNSLQQKLVEDHLTGTIVLNSSKSFAVASTEENLNTSTLPSEPILSSPSNETSIINDPDASVFAVEYPQIQPNITQTNLAVLVELESTIPKSNKVINADAALKTYPSIDAFQITQAPLLVSLEKIQQVGLQQEIISENAFLKTTMEFGPQNPQKIISKQSKWALQLYSSPSISYRYLMDDTQYEEDANGTTGPLAPWMTNSVNEFVTHKPKLGIELGGAVLFQLADNFRLKTGVQLNYRQYGIIAYQTPQAQPAMLALNPGNGVSNRVQYTNLNTQVGYKQLDLTSNFLQLAVPLGFDLKMAEIKNVDLYVSASGQLTYQLASSNYYISSDYRNYLKQPDLDRKFNINTAIEAFASFKAGGVTWQAGPQIRYQLLPGSKNAYPIREHLIDYGMKVGIIKTLK